MLDGLDRSGNSAADRSTGSAGAPANAQRPGGTADQQHGFPRELNFASGLPAQVDPVPSTTAPDVDVSGRITPLGIGDLKVVEQLCSPMSPARWRISKTCWAN